MNSNKQYLDRADRELQILDAPSYILEIKSEIPLDIEVSIQHTESLVDFLHVISEFIDFDKIISIADIGSWFGKQAAEFNNIFPNASVYAFEPDPCTFPYTQSFLSETRVNLHQVAISDEDSFKTFFHTLGHFGGTSSLLEPELVPFIEDQTTEQYHVNTARLSTFIESGKMIIPQIMKIDVQGNECSLLEGVGKYLDDVLAIHLEVGIEGYYKNQKLKEDVFRVFRQFYNHQNR